MIQDIYKKPTESIVKQLNSRSERSNIPNDNDGLSDMKTENWSLVLVLWRLLELKSKAIDCTQRKYSLQSLRMSCVYSEVAALLESIYISHKLCPQLSTSWHNILFNPIMTLKLRNVNLTILNVHVLREYFIGNRTF